MEEGKNRTLNKVEQSLADTMRTFTGSKDYAEVLGKSAAGVSAVASKDFFIWLIRVAKIDVLDAEKAIEAHGFNDGQFIPVLTIHELYDKWLKDEGVKAT